MTRADADRYQALEAQIQARLGLVPSFFRLAESAEALERLWEQTRSAYLDNPIPWLFKEELFTYLSRFCEVPYCLARHAAFLMADDMPERLGEQAVAARSVEDVLTLIRRPIPDDSELEIHFKRLAEIDQPIESWPADIHSDLGAALFACSVHAFLVGETARRCLGELRRVLGSERLERLVALLGFVRFAHDWTRAHPEIELESDLEELLAAHPSLREWVDRYDHVVASEARGDAIRELDRLAGEHESLKQAMETLGSVLDDSSNEILIFDAETLRFMQANRGALRNLGYSMEELREMTPRELDPDGSHDALGERLGPLRAGEEGRVEFNAIHRRKDGSEYPVEIHLRSATYQDRLALVAIVLDLSERRAQQRRVEESEARARAILNTAPDSILTINESGIIEGLNAATERVFGYARSELLGTNVRILMPRVHAEAHDQYLARYLSTGVPHIIGSGRELEGRKKDGTLFPIRLSVSETRFDGQRLFTGVIHDLTKENRIEAELDESTRRLRALFAQRLSLSGLCALDGRLLDANQAALDYIGVERQAVIDQPFWETAWWTHDPALQAQLREGLARAAQGEYVRFDATHPRPDGSLGTVDFSITPVRDSDDRIDVLLVESIDISERRSLQEQLLQSQKMEAIGTLAGGIAHDFNNLLTSIRGSDEILLDHLEPEGRMARSARRIMTAVDRATELTTRLLGLSRQKVSQRGPVDLNHVVQETRDLLVRTLPEDVELDTDLASEAVFARADEGQLTQVLMNLVVNACDAMPGGGRLLITARRGRLEPDRAESLGVAAGDFVAVGVRDRGEGIDPETLGRIFDPFFTTKEPGKGTGLGLAMSHVIVQEHGGAIEVESTLGVGTTFTVWLPEIDGPRARTESSAERGSSATRSRQGDDRASEENILVVEDDDVMRGLVVEVLEEAGYRVLEASSPEDALSSALSQVSEFDLLISDVVMPGMTGFDLYDELRSRHGKLQVLYMSGYSDQVLADRGELKLEDPFIRKPFGNGELLTTVRAVLDSPLPDA